jgi:hypothetical protein
MISGGTVVNNTVLLIYNLSVHGNCVRNSRIRSYVAATAFGVTVSGAGIGVYIGSSTFTRNINSNKMGSAHVFKSSIDVSNNSLSHCDAVGTVLFGRSSCPDVRGGGISLFLGLTAVSFASANWRIGLVDFLSSSMMLFGNQFVRSAVAASDSSTFGLIVHGAAISLFLGAAPLLLIALAFVCNSCVVLFVTFVLLYL